VITHEHAEDRIQNWLHAIASDAMPERAVAQAFDRTSRSPQRSRARPSRAFATRFLPVFRATSALGVVVVLTAVLFGPGGVAAPAFLGEPFHVGGGPQFGPVLAIAGTWPTDDGVAFTVRRDPTDRHVYYWRAVVFDTILEQGATWGRPTEALLQPGVDFGGSLSGDIGATTRRTAGFTITRQAWMGPIVVSPETPIAVDRASHLVTLGAGGHFAALDVREPGPYTVTALVPNETIGPAAFDAAGTAYPPEVIDLYTSLPASLFGTSLTALREEIVATAQSAAPIDVVTRTLEVLQSPAFTYDVDVRDVDCGSTSSAECFATFRRGYCQHYAITMIAILRDLGIPARLVQGFLPGEVDARTEVETVRVSRTHAWVEVYFPGLGWVQFDPTPAVVTHVTNVDPSVR
jgi:transglutaminase superfamily protein